MGFRPRSLFADGSVAASMTRARSLAGISWPRAPQIQQRHRSRSADRFETVARERKERDGDERERESERKKEKERERGRKCGVKTAFTVYGPCTNDSLMPVKRGIPEIREGCRVARYFNSVPVYLPRPFASSSKKR